MLYADRACTYIEESDPHRYVYTGPCLLCNNAQKVTIPGPALYKYRKGAHIQDAMPTLTDGEREFLVTGICNDCFNKLFAEEE
jgi:hypothetical protein